jgi:hypothetical protein
MSNNKERYAYCLKCTCHMFNERIKIIDAFVLYDFTAPKPQKIRLQPSQIIITFNALKWK